MTITGKAFLEAIEQQAIAKFGEKKWRAEIARAYVQVLQDAGDDKATYETRRSQVHRVFNDYSCTLDTAIALAAAVDCRFNMECKVLVEEFKTVL